MRDGSLHFLFDNMLAARGLEDPRNIQELLTESVGPVHFPDLSCLFRNI